MKINNNFKQYLEQKADRVTSVLEKILYSNAYSNVHSNDHPNVHSNFQSNVPSNESNYQRIYSSKLLDAIRYAVFNGGKRLRPVLVYATGESLGAPLEKLDAAAAAVELIHCYSLIHDDLPAMDNDDLRRGKPTCHKAFDEATAILAGDALQALAFEVLADSNRNLVPKEAQLEMILTLAKSSGHQGMVGGQALDIACEIAGNTSEKVSGQTKDPHTHAYTHAHTHDLDLLSNIHHQKTGALIEACVLLGAIAADCSDKVVLKQLKEYAACVGLSFQVQDDILDVIGESKIIGKTAGKDAKQNKISYPNLLGLEAAREYAQELHRQALESLQKIHFAEPAKLTKFSDTLQHSECSTLSSISSFLNLASLSEYFIQRIA